MSKLLIITQKVDSNDPILGFFHRWIEEFAKNYESVVVVCLEKGSFNLPNNVRILSLGKENSKSRIKYLLNFYKYIFRERKNYDSVFVHMNQVYVLLGGLFWKIWGKKVGLWYVHKQTSFSLWLAEKLVNNIFTSAKESFKLESGKVNYVGHGIDTGRFKFSNISDSGKVLHVGRITRIKNIETIMRAVGAKTLALVGEAVTGEDKKYKKELENLVKNLNIKVEWLGAVPNDQLPLIYSNHSFSVNATPTGGMDKAVLESLAVGCPAFVSNLIFKNIFGEYSEKFIFEFKNKEDLARKVDSWEQNKDKEKIMEMLSNKVRNEYDVSTLVKKLTKIMNLKK